MDRKVENIISEWRQLERELDASTDDAAREELEARIALRAEEHRAAFERRRGEDEPPEQGLLGARP